MELRPLVAEKFGTLEKCYGHCDEPPILKFLNSDETPIVAGYSCHAAYLSRIVVYAESLDFKDTFDRVRTLVGSNQDVREEDVRVVSMYPWDLGMTGDDQRVLTAAYWTQNYRRSKSEDPNRSGLFLCGKCQGVFAQPVSYTQVLCLECRP